MRYHLQFRFFLGILSVLAGGFIFVSCNSSINTPDVTPTEIIASPTITPTITPTQTPQPPLVVLIAPPSSDPVLVDNLQSLLSELATQAGLQFNLTQTFTATDFSTNDIRIVFSLPPDPGIAEMAAAAPNTQFVAIGIPGLQASSNISLISTSVSRPDQAGFLAGIIAATTTDDFRVGVIYPSETALGKAARRGFSKGVSFYCGLCQPVNPPYPLSNYPLFYELPAAAVQLDWDAAIVYFNEWQVKTIYITPDLTDIGLSEYLAKADFQIISHGTPANSLQDKWTASIGTGDALQMVQSHWEDFLSGKGGFTIEAPIEISFANESRLSPGKRHFIDGILSDLSDGYIDTGVDPVTGEWKP